MSWAPNEAPHYVALCDLRVKAGPLGKLELDLWNKTDAGALNEPQRLKMARTKRKLVDPNQ